MSRWEWGRYGVLGLSPHLRAWGDPHPVGMAVGQALGFAGGRRQTDRASISNGV